MANATSSKCQPGEVHCLCLDTQFINTTSTCFASSCNGTDLDSADKAARDNCALAVCSFFLPPLDKVELLMNRDAGRYPLIVLFRYGGHKFEYRFEQIQQRRIDNGQHYGRRSCSGPRSSCALGSSQVVIGQSFVFTDRHFF